MRGWDDLMQSRKLVILFFFVTLFSTLFSIKYILCLLSIMSLLYVDSHEFSLILVFLFLSDRKHVSLKLHCEIIYLFQM